MQRKEDIYVIMHNEKALHAVKTIRQAKRFIVDWNSMCETMAKSEHENNLTPGIIGWQQLTYQKIKLIHPRQFSDKQMSSVKQVLIKKENK